MHVFISVGEPSGDLHAANLIAELHRQRPGLRITGFGGPLMEQQRGFENLFRLTDLAVMGILHVLPLLGRFLRLLMQARRHLRTERPEVVVLVDCPGFNWWVARFAKGAGIPVVYYLPPQLWAWGAWRIRRVRKFVDRVLACLPFEFDWYRERGVNVTYVGHPFFDEVASRTLDDEFLARFGGAVDRGSWIVDRLIQGRNAKSEIRRDQVVAILPGSRNHEIELNFDVQLEVAARLHEQVPGLVFLVACYKESQRQMCEERWRAFWSNRNSLHQAHGSSHSPLTTHHSPPSIEFHVGKTSEIIEAADVCLMVSGSVSLELLARGTPAVVLFRIDRFAQFLAWLLVDCKFISLPNLIADVEVMPEFLITGNVEPAVGRMTDRLRRWLTDPASRREVASKLDELRREACAQGATEHAAQAVLEFVEATTVRRAA
jgi:lipid-A-disaccharide synthase